MTYPHTKEDAAFFDWHLFDVIDEEAFYADLVRDVLSSPSSSEIDNKGASILFLNQEDHTHRETRSLVANSWLSAKPSIEKKKKPQKFTWAADRVQQQYDQGPQKHIKPNVPYFFGK